MPCVERGGDDDDDGDADDMISFDAFTFLVDICIYSCFFCKRVKLLLGKYLKTMLLHVV